MHVVQRAMQAPPDRRISQQSKQHTDASPLARCCALSARRPRGIALSTCSKGTPAAQR